MKYIKLALLGLFCLFSATCILLCFLPTSWAVYGPAADSINIESITIVRNYDLVHLTALLLAILFLTLACISLKVKKLPFRLCLWIFPLVLYPVSYAKSVLDNLGEWTYEGTVKDAAGNTYWFLDSSFLQGQEMAIGRLKERTPMLDRFAVLAATNGDYPRKYLNIVRPNNVKEGYGQLYLTEEHWLVGVRSENRMFLAYDLQSQKPYVQDDVMALSPFILIGRNTHLNKSDCEEIKKIGIGNKVGQPHEKVILEGLKNSNPDVTTFAKLLLSRKKSG